MECGAKVEAEAPKAESKGKIQMPSKESQTKKPEPTVKKVSSEPEEEPEEEHPASIVDFSKIDPERDWECFGSIEPDHTECKKCPAREKCAVKAGVSL